jgi:hypothetical protein
MPNAKLTASYKVMLLAAPPVLLRGLPREDQDAIRSIIGKPVTLARHSFGRAELVFTDSSGNHHSVSVDPSLIHRVD